MHAGAVLQVHINISIRGSDDDLLHSTYSTEGGSGQAFAFILERGCRGPRAWEVALKGGAQLTLAVHTYMRTCCTVVLQGYMAKPLLVLMHQHPPPSWALSTHRRPRHAVSLLPSCNAVKLHTGATMTTP
jgi:hypothetical protein